MYMNLQKQAYEWMEAIKGMTNKEVKRKFNLAYNANKNFMSSIEAALPGELTEQFWNDSEYFSQVLEYIRKAKTPDEKQNLILLMREFTNGTLKIIEDGNHTEIL